MTIAHLLLFFLFFAGLITAIYSDMKTRTVPNLAPLLLFAAGIVNLFSEASSINQLVSALMGAAIGGLPLLIMALCRDSVGGGDVKLAASAGFVLGWLWSYLALMIALFAFVFYGCLSQPKKNKVKLPFLPFAPFYGAAACVAFVISSVLCFSTVHISIF